MENNNNEKKRFGRRAGSGIVYTALITGAYILCIFKGTSLEWFESYVRVMTLALGFVIGGLTITDWRLKK